jgi:hypothetical protein
MKVFDRMMNRLKARTEGLSAPNAVDLRIVGESKAAD